MVPRTDAVALSAVATVGLLAACSDPSARRAADPAGPALHAFGTYRTLEGGTVVEVVFAGFPDDNGPCGADYHAVASETAERVYVQVQVLREPGPRGQAAGPVPQATPATDAVGVAACAHRRTRCRRRRQLAMLSWCFGTVDGIPVHRRARCPACPVCSARLQDDQVVAVDDLALVLGPELPGQVPRRAAEQAGHLRRRRR